MNLINNALLIPPNEYRYCRYCPREEIAHPLKLKSIVDSCACDLQWQIHRYDMDSFYMIWLPWFRVYKSYDENIHTSLFHVLTEKPSMFKIFKKIIHNPHYSKSNLKDNNIKELYIHELSDWLAKWWNCPFLITIPILHHERGAFITDNLYPPRRTYLQFLPSQEYLDLQLSNQSYTVCNGLTLFLAYHRLNIITANIAYPILKNFIDINKPHIFQDVTDTWYNLYYNTVIGHIADFPTFYISSGPDFAHVNILRLFKDDYDFQFAEMIIPNNIIYTSPLIAMFPYFSPINWNYFQTTELWLNTLNINYDNGDVLFPDIAGFIHAMLTTKRAWKYWQNNHIDILICLSSSYISLEKLIEDLIQACSYYYNYGSPYHNRSLKKKVRIMWNNIISTLDKTKESIPEIFYRYILKYQMGERLLHIGRTGTLWMNEIPYSLLKDIFRLYCHELDIYKPVRYVIMTEHIDVLRIIYPDITMNTNITHTNTISNNSNMNENTPFNIIRDGILNTLLNNKYVIYKSPISTLRESFTRSTMSIFYNTHIHKRILFKLCILYKAFGIKINRTGTLYNDYLVGELLLNFYKKNKNYLIE